MTFHVTSAMGPSTFVEVKVCDSSQSQGGPFGFTQFWTVCCVQSSRCRRYLNNTVQYTVRHANAIVALKVETRLQKWRITRKHNALNQ